jgi:hypothetical protein
VLAFVTAQGDPEKGIVAVLETPLPDIAGYSHRIHSVYMAIPLLVRIGRVEEYPRQAVAESRRRATDPRPVSAADAHEAQPVGQGGEIGV